MYAGLSIQALDAKETLFVLRDERGNPMGTGTREAMEMLCYIADQSNRSEVERNVASVPDHVCPSPNLRSALVL